MEPHRPRDGGQGLQRGAVHRRSGGAARLGLRGDVADRARARRRIQRRARDRPRADRRRARRLLRADRCPRLRGARCRGGLPAGRGALQEHRLQRRGARPPRGAEPLVARGARGAAKRSRSARGMARARGGRGEGGTRPDGLGAVAARDPRRGPPGRRPRPVGGARGTARPCGARLGGRRAGSARRYGSAGRGRAGGRLGRRAVRRAGRAAAPARGERQRAGPPAHARGRHDRVSLSLSPCAPIPGPRRSPSSPPARLSKRSGCSIPTPRRRPRQGRADRGVRPRPRPRSPLLRRRDGHRPPSHAGRRRRRGLSRPHRTPRHDDHGHAAVGAGGGELPGGSRASRGRRAR